MNSHKPGLRDVFFRNVHLLGLSIIVLILAGASALTNLPRIEDPRIATRNALIITPMPGASAQRVEALVTKKIEEQLREVEEIKHLQSTSRANISVISVELEDDIDADTNEAVFSKIRDRLADSESELPPEAGSPEFDDERGASAFALVVALTANGSASDNLAILGRLAEELADRFRNLPGAERVRIYGGTEEEITLTLDRGELAAQGLSAAVVAQRVAAADPKNAAGAFRGAHHDLFIEVAGELDSVSRIRNLVLRRDEQGRLLRVGDVATVQRGWRQPVQSKGFINGQRAVFVAAGAEAGVRIDQWQIAAQQLLTNFEAQLDDGIGVEVVFEQSKYTDERLRSLSNNLLLGATVVMLVVLLGLGWRAALIVGAALPLSAFATLFGLTFFDQQIHQMTMFGMIIAIGLLIDNAIVVTDEVQKRLRRGMSRRQAVSAAVSHLFTPLLASTVTTILGFMPIFLLPGNIGDFVGPIAISVVLALALSFVISMTIIAALGGHLIRVSDNTAATPGRWWQVGLQAPRVTDWSRRALVWAFDRPLTTVTVSLLLPVLGFGLAGTLKLQFFPPAERNQFEIEVWMPDESSLERTRKTAAAIETTLREFDGVEQVSWLVGGSHPQLYYNRIMKQDNNTAYAHAMVQTDTARTATALVSRLRPVLDERFTESQIIVASFAQGPPVDAPMGFRIVGPSLPVLIEKGHELRRVMHQVPEIGHTRSSLSSRAKLVFAADQTKTELVGLSLDGLSQQLQGNLEGFTGGSVREDLEELPLRIRYNEEVRGSLSNIASMPLLSVANDQWIPADVLGDMRLEPEAASITRRNGERVNIIHGWVAPGALPIQATDQVLALLDAQGFALPPGYVLQLEGDSDAQKDAVGKLFTYLPVLIMLMIATLILSFRSVSAAGIIGLVAFLSAGLGMLSLWLSGYNLGFNPMIGSAGLIGVAINGAIVVLAALRADPQARLGDTQAVVRVTLGETRHVLATTATTIGGFLPLFALTDGEFWPPLAVVIAGGVGFSVILSLLFTPALFTLLIRGRGRGARVVAGLVSATALSGCVVGPEYLAPPQVDTGSWIEIHDSAEVTVLDGWWRRFDDPLITQYVEKALQQNHDVRIATSRLREVRALQKQTQSLLLPQLDAQVSFARSRSSEESPEFNTGKTEGSRTNELYDAGFDAVWELDIFGGNRRRVQAGSARIEVAEALLGGVRLSVTAEVVRSFAELRGAQRRLEVARQNQELQQQTLALVRGRLSSGLAPELDVLNASAQLERTRSSIPVFEGIARSAIYRLATLTATDTALVARELSAHMPLTDPSTVLRPGLRGDVLRGRPDIRAAERQVATASAEIGVSIAELYPRFVLNAQFGWQAMSAGALGNSETSNSRVLPFVRLPLFNGGRLRAQVEAARARHKTALLEYERGILLAVEESEGALARYHRAKVSRDHLAAAAHTSAQAAEISRRLYDSGLAGFLSVLDADRRRLEVEDALAARQTQVLVELVAVYKALGAS